MGTNEDASRRDFLQSVLLGGVALGVDYRLTHSCYDPSPEGLSCGQCDSCHLRRKGFAEAGLTDPLPYQRL